MSVLYTDNPKSGNRKATPAIITNLQDPDLFLDDDGSAYMFWGSSNKWPIRGMKLNKNHRFIQEGEKLELFNLDPEKHGWERFGENHADTVLGGYIEGPWLTKHNGRYYMQYAAPGTQFNVYADGVYVADHPMGPYTYQKHNPISYKPGGYINGAGHGSTVLGPGGQYGISVLWLCPLICTGNAVSACSLLILTKTASCIVTPVLEIIPVMHLLCRERKGSSAAGCFFSYNKPARGSSAVEGHTAAGLTDENCKTYWLASSNDETQWVEIDLQAPATVNAIQVNYNDYKSDMYGRYPGLRHRYTIEGSVDGINRTRLVNRSNSFKDTPHDYVELETPARVRYVRYKNIHVPTPHLSISAIRIFGLGEGKAPAQVKTFDPHRHEDRRDITLTWKPVKGAQGYNILWGYCAGQALQFLDGVW